MSILSTALFPGPKTEWMLKKHFLNEFRRVRMPSVWIRKFYTLHTNSFSVNCQFIFITIMVVQPAVSKIWFRGGNLQGKGKHTVLAFFSRNETPGPSYGGLASCTASPLTAVCQRILSPLVSLKHCRKGSAYVVCTQQTTHKYLLIE